MVIVCEVVLSVSRRPGIVDLNRAIKVAIPSFKTVLADILEELAAGQATVVAEVENANVRFHKPLTTYLTDVLER